MRHFISQIWLMANVCVPERHQIACPDSTHRHTHSYTLIVVLSRQANKETNESQAHTVCTRENPQGNADSQTMQTARVTSRSHCLKLNIWVWTFFATNCITMWVCECVVIGSLIHSSSFQQSVCRDHHCCAVIVLLHWMGENRVLQYAVVWCSWFTKPDSQMTCACVQFDWLIFYSHPITGCTFSNISSSS